MCERQFLEVNAFLTTELDARAIRSAMELGVLDALDAGGPLPLATLACEHRLAAAGLALLLDLLEANGVVAYVGGRAAVELTPQFRRALQFRDLLMSRIEFADLVWPDLHTLFTPLLNDPPQFMGRSRVFDLFRYDRCFDPTPENLAAAAAWTRFTTCLTKYEAGPALDALDLDGIESSIDLGGNTGEFALRICQCSPAIRATVVDLPVVCALGQRHIAEVAAPDEARRIAFFPTDMRQGALPAAADLVSFKSVLHDWPDRDARRLLQRARAVVRPGGRLLIFERAPIAAHGRPISYAVAPFLAFLHFLRPAELYVQSLAELGFVAIESRRLALDTEFHLVTARLPG